MSGFEDSREYARRQDAADPLRDFRERFLFPARRARRDPVYLCGNSLGLQPANAAAYVAQVLDAWAELAVDGHFDGERPWTKYHRLATEGLATLAGARPDEVVAMNTLTVNLHVLMASFYRPDSTRFKIVIESQAFPSDRYAAVSQLRLQGHDPATALLEWAPRDDELLYLEDLEALLGEHGDSIALLLLPGVQYYTGQVLDMPGICELARDSGCAVGLDLAHAVGNVELRLHEWAPDFASWCTYKYLNAGPGAIAAVFVPERHWRDDAIEHLLGWWGNDLATRFEMRAAFDPATGAESWQMSNPPILSLAPLLASLETFSEAGMPRLIDKSTRLTGYLAFLLESRFGGRIATLTPEHARGCQLSLVVRDPDIDSRKLFERLHALNVTGDWREPAVIRVAPVPLYNSFEDVFDFAERLAEALDEQ